MLADEKSPAFAAGAFSALPQQMVVLERLLESFRTGIGLPYDAFGPEGHAASRACWRRGSAPCWCRSRCRALDGVVAKLDAGAKVADVGCGAGVALIEMAKAYPRSQFHGYEISEHALARAERNRRRPGSPTSPSTTPTATRCRRTAASTSSPPSTASTT